MSSSIFRTMFFGNLNLFCTAIRASDDALDGSLAGLQFREIGSSPAVTPRNPPGNGKP